MNQNKQIPHERVAHRLPVKPKQPRGSVIRRVRSPYAKKWSGDSSGFPIERKRPLKPVPRRRAVMLKKAKKARGNIPIGLLLANGITAEEWKAAVEALGGDGDRDRLAQHLHSIAVPNEGVSITTIRGDKLLCMAEFGKAAVAAKSQHGPGTVQQVVPVIDAIEAFQRMHASGRPEQQDAVAED